MDLKHTYFFTAYYKDGTEYVQGEDDTSLQNPEKNAYYDIYYQPLKPLSDLWAFCIRAVEGYEPPPTAPRAVAVNLINGTFEVDGVNLVLHDEDVRGFEPIFYRIMNQHREVNRSNGETSFNDRSEIAGYGIGWKGKTGKGKTVEKFIRIALV